MNQNAYQEITNKIINQLQNGTVPWEQPWFGANGATSYATGKQYSLLNQLLLGDSSEYLTWNQIQQNNAHLRKGSRGKRVFFYKTLAKPVTDDKGEIVSIKQIPFLKTYTVFKVEDCDGIKPRWQTKHEGVIDTSSIKQFKDAIQKYLDREHIELKHDTNEAYYSKKHDFINLPPISNFKSVEDYAGTLVHEVTHSSGAAHRLNRNPNNIPAPFGSKEYSREELVAEMGASFLLKKFNIDTQRTLEQNAAYIKNWISILSNDISLVAVAAGRAEKAVQYILGNEE